jgi:hypothetical protein
MILSHRQKQSIEKLIDGFKEAVKVNGFNKQSHKLYYDQENDRHILVTPYERVLCNILEDSIAMTVIDRKGKIQPLSHTIKFAQDRLKYLDTITLIKTYE